MTIAELFQLEQFEFMDIIVLKYCLNSNDLAHRAQRVIFCFCLWVNMYTYSNPD